MWIMRWKCTPGGSESPGILNMFVLMHEKDNSILANEYISTLDYENQHEEEREFEMVFIFIIRELVHKSTMTK